MPLRQRPATVLVAIACGCAGTRSVGAIVNDGASGRSNASGGADSSVGTGGADSSVSTGGKAGASAQDSGSGTVEKPGPSPALFAAPFYSCLHNYYVATTGSDSADGSSAQPWKTLQHANDVGRAAGDCVNVRPGSYSAGVNVTHGGSLASSTGYVVYRCTELDRCIITDSWKGFAIDSSKFPMPNYFVVDGFEFAAASETAYGQGIKVWAGGTLNNSSHHVWVLNNVIHGYGQSGVQMNDGEYHYVIHNTMYDNSNATCDAQGSGISLCVEKAFTGYVATADDAKYDPFHNVVAWNVTYNNGLTQAYCPGTSHTDGNGIIMDTFNNSGSTNVDYPNKSLVAFNVSYNNGGFGVHLFRTSHIIVANNSTYDNALDTGNTGTYRPDIGTQTGADNLIVNNIAYAIVGPAPLDSNAAYVAGGTGQEATFSHNIALGTARMSQGNVFSCTANKCNTDPLWIDVGRTSPGSATTPPRGANFALSAKSPARGYGQTQSYLSAQAIDVGACSSKLAVCP